MTENAPIPITFLYFDSCPNWREANAALAQAATMEEVELRVRYRTVETVEAAAELEFRGSPTLLINGEDPFADPDSPVSLSCRIYRSETGSAGAPGVREIRAVLRGVAAAS